MEGLSLHLTSSLLIKIHEMKLCDGSTVAFKPMKTLMVLILILCEGPCVQGMYIGGGAYQSRSYSYLARKGGVPKVALDRGEQAKGH